MNFGVLLFTFLAFTVVKAMALEEADPGLAFAFPEFPTFNHVDAPNFVPVQGLDSFDDFTENLTEFFRWLGEMTIALFNLLVDLLVFIFLFVAFLIRITVTTFGPGTPWWINALVLLPQTLLVILAVLKLVRTGDES